MRKTTKRLISLICALSLILMSLGNIGFAEEYSAEDIKVDMDAVSGDVTLDNWKDYEEAIDNIVAKKATLIESELLEFEAMENADGVKYDDILDSWILTTETGPAYDAIMALPKDEYDMTTGSWMEGVTIDNYQTWYPMIVDVSILVDALTTEQQRLIGETVLAIYSTALEECEYYWFDDVEAVASSLENVNASNNEWADMEAADKLSKYQTKRKQYEKAVAKVDELYTTNDDAYKPDQRDDVETALEEKGINKTIDEILDEAKAYIDGIIEDSMNDVISVKAEIEAMLPVSIDNCAEIFSKATDALADYEVIKTSVGENYWNELKNDELENALTNYKNESQNWIDAKAFVDVVDEFIDTDYANGITSDNYTALKDKYDNSWKL